MNEIDRYSEIIDFRETLDPETDRGCALMAAAYLDEQLKKILEKGFVPHRKLHRKVFGPNGPVGTFSARIDFAYLLGYIGPKAHHDLHLIRAIRNDFGHTATPLTFDNPSIADRCRDLYYDLGVSQLPPRKKFTRVVLGVLAPIHYRKEQISEKAEARDITICEKMSAEFVEFTEAIFTALKDCKEKTIQSGTADNLDDA